MPKGMPLGKKIYRIDRYAGVKLRQRLRATILSGKWVGMRTTYKKFLSNGWIPLKSDGELLEELGFKAQYYVVKKDLNNKCNEFFVKFLYKAVTNSFRDFYKQAIPNRGYNGMRELKRMTGLHEATIRDILILNGSIK